MCVKVAGTETMANYAGLLMKFGEYSGIGIKTAIGMGPLRKHCIYSSDFDKYNAYLAY